MEVLGGGEFEGRGCELAELGKARGIQTRTVAQTKPRHHCGIFVSRTLKWTASLCQVGKNFKCPLTRHDRPLPR